MFAACSHTSCWAIGVWMLVHESALHATLAGVVLGLLAPTRPFRHPDMVDAEKLADVSTVRTAEETVTQARESVSVVEWLEYRLHPWSSYLIVPVFALANAGVVISSDSIADAAASPVTHGIVVGLVVGKLVGIAGTTWLACRLGLSSLPEGTGWPEVVGIAALGGIGFTVSLFVSNLAFRTTSGLASDAKLGILTASVVAALLGTAILVFTDAKPGPQERTRNVTRDWLESGGVADLLGHSHADRNEDQDDEELLHHKPFRQPSSDIVGGQPRDDNGPSTHLG